MQQNNEDVYVLGFVFTQKGILLIHKTHGPGDQKNKFNGVGGKLKFGELHNPVEGMVREFKEETDLSTSNNQWEYVDTIQYSKVKVICFTTSLNFLQENKLNRILDKQQIGLDKEYLINITIDELKNLHFENNLVRDVWEISENCNIVIRNKIIKKLKENDDNPSEYFNVWTSDNKTENSLVNLNENS